MRQTNTQKILRRSGIPVICRSCGCILLPSGGAQGQATEINIAAEHILKTRKKLNEILATNTGKPIKTIERDTERDNYMSAEEALKYGLIDQIITR